MTYTELLVLIAIVSGITGYVLRLWIEKREEKNKWLFVKVRELAQNLGFDMHRVPAKYFVLCDWYSSLVKMFDDTPMGDDEAIQWMREQKEE